jgi:hypothetical protein
MFRRLTLRGPAAAILWGYREAAVLRAWTVARVEDPAPNQPPWTLTAQVDHADAFQLRQHPLVFTAVREGRIGRWCFPVLSVRVTAASLVATLGAPEY